MIYRNRLAISVLLIVGGALLAACADRGQWPKFIGIGSSALICTGAIWLPTDYYRGRRWSGLQ